MLLIDFQLLKKDKKKFSTLNKRVLLAHLVQSYYSTG